MFSRPYPRNALDRCTLLALLPSLFRYDHICKLWDVRSGQCSMSVNHGAPVESVAFLPTGVAMSLVLCAKTG